MRNLFRNEPVLITGLVEAAIILAVAFGAGLTPEQTGAILGFVALLTSFIARSMVTPVAKDEPEE